MRPQTTKSESRGRSSQRRGAEAARSALAVVATVLTLGSASESLAQVTQQQRSIDFPSLVGVSDKQYGPYEWKRRAVRYDLLDTEKRERQAS